MSKFLIALMFVMLSFAANANPYHGTPYHKPPHYNPPAAKSQCHGCVQKETANSVKLKFSSIDKAIVSQVKINGSPFSQKNVYIGSYNLDIQGEGVFSGFCVDPYQSASSSYGFYDKSSLDPTDFNNHGTTRFANAQKLFDHAYSTLTTAAQTAGFHLALWEIFHDDLNVLTGGIKADSVSNPAMLSAASDFLGDLAGWDITKKYSIDFFKSVCNQDFIIAKLNPPSEVPLPAALPMFLTGLAGLGFMRRRKAS